MMLSPWPRRPSPNNDESGRQRLRQQGARPGGGPRRQHDGYAGAHDDARQGRSCEVFEVFCQDVAGIEIGRQEYVDLAGHFAVDPFCLCGPFRDGVIKVVLQGIVWVGPLLPESRFQARIASPCAIPNFIKRFLALTPPGR